LLKSPNHILIVRFSSIGDIILTTAVVRCIRKAYPSARISFLTKKEYAPLVEYNTDINEVIAFDKQAGTGTLIRQVALLKPDWLVDLHNNIRSNLLRTRLRFPEVSTYSKQSFRRQLLIRFGNSFIREAKPVYLKYFDAVQHRKIAYDGAGTSVTVPLPEVNEIRTKLASDGWLANKPLVVICPGASFKNKEWIPEKFGKVADRLIESHEAFVVFLGGKADRELCERIIGGMNAKAPNYAGHLSLLGSASLLQMADVVLTNDSGMMHLAQSQKTAVVAIFGPTSRELGFFPFPDQSKVVEKELSCRPCTTKGLNHCPKKHFNCMNLIGSEEVYDALSSFLKKG
jgi:lipopolysaccharide heptosyltransferase II